MLAYVPHLVITVAALPMVWAAPETVLPNFGGPGFVGRLRVPAAGHRRFLRVVAPAAPWVFGAPSIAFAVLPSLVSAHLHGFAIVFSAVLAAITLGTGVLIQPLARRLDHPGQITGALLGLAATVVGVLIGVAAAATVDPVLAFVAAVPRCRWAPGMDSV